MFCGTVLGKGCADTFTIDVFFSAALFNADVWNVPVLFSSLTVWTTVLY